MRGSNTTNKLLSSAALRFAVPVISVAISLAVTFPLQPYGFRAVLHILCILVSAWVGGFGPGLLALLLWTASITLCLRPAGPLVAACPNVAYSIPYIVAFVVTALLAVWWSAARRRAENALREGRDEFEVNVQGSAADLSRSNA